MRPHLIATALLCTILSGGALAEGGTARLDPQGKPDREMNTETKAVATLEQLHKRLEAAGYKDVQVMPSAIVVSAKDGNGNPTLLLVDLASMLALRLDSPNSPAVDSGTTGSGSPDERER
jgi:hypothetical protein